MSKQESLFVWTDLSTFDVERAKNFYTGIFQWGFDVDASGYQNAFFGESAAAGLYEMPEPFQKIGMPSFWMSYLAVENLEKVKAKAKKLGGKIELEDQNALGKVLLIRDPAGAGFTCYEGHAPALPHNRIRPSHWCGSELMVSDIGLVKEFYEELFHWVITPAGSERYAIRTESGETLGAIQVASKEVKGSKEFWAAYFSTDDLDQTFAMVRRHGGKVEGPYPHEKGRQALAYDDQGAAFFLLESRDNSETISHEQGSFFRKWRSVLGLAFIYLAVFSDQHWVWGLLFLLWVLPDLKSGITHFMEPLDRRSHPWLYWITILSWLLLSAWMLLE